MGKFVSFAIASFLCFLALSCPSHAQNSPQDYLNAHNAARSQVGVGPMVWDNNLAIYAFNYIKTHIEDCQIVHSGGPYGENLAWSSGDISGMDAVKLWVDEKASYDFDSNSCAANEVCGHYTQVVWRSSTQLGCARVICHSGGTLVICSYDPRGNRRKPY